MNLVDEASDEVEERMAHQLDSLVLSMNQRHIANAIIGELGCFKTTDADELGVVPLYQSFVRINEAGGQVVNCIDYAPLVLNKHTDIVDPELFIRENKNTWLGRRLVRVMDRLDKMRVYYTLHKLTDCPHGYCLVSRNKLNKKMLLDDERSKYIIFRKIESEANE